MQMQTLWDQVCAMFNWGVEQESDYILF